MEVSVQGAGTGDSVGLRIGTKTPRKTSKSAWLAWKYPGWQRQYMRWLTRILIDNESHLQIYLGDVHSIECF